MTLGRNFEIVSFPETGKKRLIQYQKPISYFDIDWKRINNNFVDSGIVNLPHLVEEAPIIVSVADDGMRRLHPTREIDRYIEIGKTLC